MDIEKNIKLHNKIAKKYESTHTEIYNDIEQSRLVNDLEKSLSFIKKSNITALDLGCGAGNLTNHLLNMGCYVIAADVSTGFLDLIEDKFFDRKVSTFQLNGEDLNGIEDNSIDFIATYSVLHHIPDYIMTINEMIRGALDRPVVIDESLRLSKKFSSPESYKFINASLDKYLKTHK